MRIQKKINRTTFIIKYQKNNVYGVHSAEFTFLWTNRNEKVKLFKQLKKLRADKSCNIIDYKIIQSQDVKTADEVLNTLNLLFE